MPKKWPAEGGLACHAVEAACLFCEGEGRQVCCRICRIFGQAKSYSVRYLNRRDVQGFPCGHEGRRAFLAVDAVRCAHCRGTGRTVRMLTEAQFARYTAKQERERRREEFSLAWELHLRCHSPRPRFLCGARCRDGHPCPRPCVVGGLRCRGHGGVVRRRENKQER